MTHAELVERAARWLKNTKRCGIVLTEFDAGIGEKPDAVGWGSHGSRSYQVECKTSLNDFYADKKKSGRCGVSVRSGIGRWRFYLTPPGLLVADTVRRMRPRWGLLEVRGRIIRVVVDAEAWGRADTAWSELPLLYSYARRIHQYGLTLDEAQAAVRHAAEDKRSR